MSFELRSSNFEWRNKLALVFFLLILNGPNALTAQQSEGGGRIMAAIVRQDGIVVPFTEFRNGSWSWPGGEITDRSTPWFVTGGAPTTWHFQPVSGLLETLTTTTPTKVASHCQSYWGLTTKFNGRAVPRNTAHRNIGAAVSGVQTLQRPIVLLARAGEATAVIQFVRSRFDGAETAALDARSAPASLAAAQRRQIPLEFASIFRSRRFIAGRHVYYVEAEREYSRLAPPSDVSCAPISLFQGWLAEDASGAVSLLQGEVVFTDCHRKTAWTVTPFGIVTIDGRSYVLTDEAAYEGERYAIVEIEERAITRRVSMYAGGC